MCGLAACGQLPSLTAALKAPNWQLVLEARQIWSSVHYSQCATSVLKHCLLPDNCCPAHAASHNAQTQTDESRLTDLWVLRCDGSATPDTLGASSGTAPSPCHSKANLARAVSLISSVICWFCNRKPLQDHALQACAGLTHSLAAGACDGDMHGACQPLLQILQWSCPGAKGCA